jgi:hypothetical protein
MGNATKLAAEEVCGKIAALARDGCSKSTAAFDWAMT